MKSKLPVTILTTAILSCTALAQQPTPPPPGAPPAPAPAGEEHRPEGPRGERRSGDERRGPGGEGRPERPDHDRRDGPGPRGPREEHGGPGGEERPGPEERRGPQPYMGVVTAPVPPPLAAQLGLPEGFGLLVLEVLPNSPAAIAGLQKFDVLKMFNDQQLLAPEQLATLVRATGKDQSAALTLVRKGQEQKASVRIGEQTPRPHGRGPLGGGEGPGERLRSPEEREERRERLRENFGERARELRERMQERRERQERPNGPKGPEGKPAPRPGDAPEPPHGAALRPADLLREAQLGGGSELKVFSDSGLTTLQGAKARLVLQDREGEIEISGEDGHRLLTARNPQQEVTFTGPVDTAEQREALPPQVRRKLEQIHVAEQNGGLALTVRTPAAPEPEASGEIQ